MLKRFFVSVLLLVSSAPAIAGSNTNGFGAISNVYGTSNGAILFTIASAVRTQGLPTCAQGSPSVWAIDASTVSGQALAAVLMSAWAVHKQIWVQGTGTCSIWGGVETVNYFNIQD